MNRFNLNHVPYSCTDLHIHTHIYNMIQQNEHACRLPVSTTSRMFSGGMPFSLASSTSFSICSGVNSFDSLPAACQWQCEMYVHENLA